MTYSASYNEHVERERARAHKARGAQSTHVVWTPQAGVQSAAYESAADQIGYGGAAGGGKSDLQIGMAGTKHRRAIIFRRVFPSLRGMIERSREIFNANDATHGKDSYNEQLHVWRLGSKQMLEFGSVQYDQDLKKYQGQPHDYLGIDEATEFPERFVRFLMGWNRTTVQGQACKLVLTFNPPMDDSGSWVIPFFAPWLEEGYADPAEDGEIRYVARIDDQDVFFRAVEDAPEEQRDQLKTRTFFHASLKDNPALASTGYGATIEALPEPLRSLLKGNFNAAKVADPWQVIPTAWIKAAQARWVKEGAGDTLLSVGVDVARGGKDKTVIAKLYGGWFAPLEKYPGSSTPDGPTVAALVLPHASSLMGISVDVIGVGGAVYDALKGTVRVTGVNFAEGAPAERDKTGKLKFRNVRALAYWRLREALDPNTGDGLALPPDAELEADLKAPKWSLTTGGILIESKEDIQERIGRSPDSGDAVALAYYGIKQRKNSAVGAFAR
jgi:hypothetical protein